MNGIGFPMHFVAVHTVLIFCRESNSHFRCQFNTAGEPSTKINKIDATPGSVDLFFGVVQMFNLTVHKIIET